jgi:1-acyl-sn-glycerol-3-phosphate acyltransferase
MAITCSDHESGRARGFDRPAVHSPNRDRMEVQAPTQSIRRYGVIRAFLHLAVRLYSRVRVEGAERLPAGPSILCFTHANWADPFYVFAAIPSRPRVYFFGPEQEDMRRGLRNRVMRWAGVVVPYRPARRGLVAAVARSQSLLCEGAVVAIAGEGRIHAGESAVLPLRDGPAYLALRAGVPIVPMAINGTTWLGFRRVVRVRVGLPIETARMPVRPNAADVLRLTAQAQSALDSLVSDFPDQPQPGLIGRWLTELFNEWPEGSRPPVAARTRSRRVAGRVSRP